MNCGNCPKTDGLVYPSYPPQVKCTVTGNLHFYVDECDCDYTCTNHTPAPDINLNEILSIRFPEPKTALEIKVEEQTEKIKAIEDFLTNGLKPGFEKLEEQLRRINSELSEM